MNAIRSQASRCVRECTPHCSHEHTTPVARLGLPLLTQETHWVGRHHVTECCIQLSRFNHCIPQWMGYERGCQFVSWHSAQSVTQLYSVVGVSQLLVKLEISLTLSGEIDNSNVKRVGEV